MTLKRLTAFVLALSCTMHPVWAQEEAEPNKPGAESLGATVDHFTGTDGESLYLRACSGCHGPDGGGAYGAASYPALAGNTKLSAARYPVNLIVEGNGAMPPFADWLDDEQIAAVVNYLQSNLGNSYEASLTADDVARMRKDFAELDGG